MSTADNNPVYFIEEDQKVSTAAANYRSKNQALLNKATQHTWKHKKVIRIFIIVTLLLIAITCGALIHAFASTHEQNNEVPANVSSIAAEARTVDVLQGDTLWSIANEYAPAKESVSSYVHKIMKLNGLRNSNIQEGQLLLLPN